MSIDGVIGTAAGKGVGGGHIVLALTTAEGVKGLLGAVRGVIVRPLITGEINAVKGKPGGIDRTAEFRPKVTIGVSAGHSGITAGTIGARVYNDVGNYFALSNKHVFANQNNAVRGVDSILQPGPSDGGTDPESKFATLSDFNVIDAAIAAVDKNVLQAKTPNGEGYGAPSSEMLALIDALGVSVQKYGRTTGHR